MSAPIEAPRLYKCHGPCKLELPHTLKYYAPVGNALTGPKLLRTVCRKCRNAQSRLRAKQQPCHTSRQFVRHPVAGRDRVSVKVCKECYDLPWQRPASGCRKCHEAYGDWPKLDVMDYVKKYLEPRGIL